jgi:hypothetical protein
MIFDWWAPSRLVFEPGSVNASKPALNAFISPCAYPVFLHIVMCASERAHNLAFGYLGCDCILFIPLLIFQLQQAKCALAISNSDSYEKPSNDHYDASAAGAIKTTESPVIPSASRHPPESCTSLTSDEQHLALFLDCPHAGLLVIFLLLSNVYGFFDVSENKVAMRVVCLNLKSASPYPCTSYSFATYV